MVLVVGCWWLVASKLLFFRRVYKNNDMANSIFTLENIDSQISEKINLDDLYERKKQHDQQQLELFKKILNRIHVRIKTISRQKIDEQSCWFVVPEVIIGVPKYDQGQCIAYLLDKLADNGFLVRYIHPNTLFITWHHWVPTYVRNEWKKKTGTTLTEFGEVVPPPPPEGAEGGDDLPPLVLSGSEPPPRGGASNAAGSTVAHKQYKPIDRYRPSGQFVYADKTMERLELKLDRDSR